MSEDKLSHNTIFNTMETMNLCRHCQTQFEPVNGIEAVRSKKDDCYLSSPRFNSTNIRMKVS